MRILLLIFSFSFTIELKGQLPTPEKLGFRHLQILFQKDTVEILVASKKGEELKTKPIFLFIQGSLPTPLIISYNKTLTYPVFPFSLDSLLEMFHVLIIGKPYIPLVSKKEDLTNDLNYVDPVTGEYPTGYVSRNYIDYYVERNLYVLSYLQGQNWVSKNEIVIAGHSEGSTIAAKMASVSDKITSLVYLSGNPFGRIMSVIERSRVLESDATSLAEKDFAIWEEIVKNPTDSISGSDTYKATYEFSNPPIQYLQKLTIPVLIMYGTKDYCSPYNDFLTSGNDQRKKK